MAHPILFHFLCPFRKHLSCSRDPKQKTDTKCLRISSHPIPSTQDSSYEEKSNLEVSRVSHSLQGPDSPVLNPKSSLSCYFTPAKKKTCLQQLPLVANT